MLKLNVRERCYLLALISIDVKNFSDGNTILTKEERNDLLKKVMDTEMEKC